MDKPDAIVIYDHFRTDSLFIQMNMAETDIQQEIKLLELNLKNALRSARARHAHQKCGLRVRFTEGIAGIFRGVPKG